MAEPLKNRFDRNVLELYTNKILLVQPSFNSKNFIAETHELIKSLELKDRIKTISKQLQLFLDGEYTDQLELLMKIQGPENSGSYGTFNEYFWVWPIASFIEIFGLDHEEISIDGIKEITKRGTGEFAIRPFIRQSPEKLLKLMLAWSQDTNFHVRRLSSEGLRPKLPWASKLTLFIDDPTPVFTILESLKNDPERYVQTSVANMINDYLKVNYEAAYDLIKKWSEEPGQNTKWIVKHSIRNFRKKEIPWAKELTERMNK